MRQPQDNTTKGEQAQAQNNGGCGLCGARFRCHPPGSPYTALTNFWFHGVSKYIKDLISRIHIPLLNYIVISFINQLIFNTPRLHSFLSHAQPFKAHNRATVKFHCGIVDCTLNSSIVLSVSCEESDWQLSAMAQLCNSSLLPVTRRSMQCDKIRFERLETFPLELQAKRNRLNQQVVLHKVM
jgi:hypothetical protein